jgi:nucleoside-diphosphate-sugar epimerase
MNKKVLLTGISGFLGAAIAQTLLLNKFSVIGLKRTTSDLWRCQEFSKEIEWIEWDVQDLWKEQIIALQPAIIIHGAWSGVIAKDRNSLPIQVKNLKLVADLLEIAEKSKSSCFIGLGSQAEYGILNKVVNENEVTSPVNAYGITKTVASTLVQKFCDLHHINWYWLRIFSVFGEKESATWFIPFVIRNLIFNEKEINLSSCTQNYAYLFVNDLAAHIGEILKKLPQPGVYNVSAREAKSLKEIVEDIKQLTGNNITQLNFGVIPKRENQSELIEGCMKKFHANVGVINNTDWQQSLEKTIDYYRNFYKNSK